MNRSNYDVFLSNMVTNQSDGDMNVKASQRKPSGKLLLIPQ